MRFKFILFWVFFVSAVLSTAFAADGLVVGDPAEKVYLELGTPKIEFPLRGTFIQQYDDCIVKSRDGKVISISQLNEPKPEEAAKEEEPKALLVKDVLAKAEAGDADSQYFMAYWSQTGQCVSQDMEEAVRWYSKAAYQGHVAAQHNLGVIYMNGTAVKKDLEQAYVWALLAAENGNDTLKKALAGRLTDDEKLASLIRADQIRVNLLTPDTEEKSVVDTFTVSGSEEMN